jgi:ArsR family transcriptional regulator, virulence genes transcriptional regulator
MDKHAQAAAELLRAMANPQRLRVLCLLLDGELAVGQINRRVGLSQSALSQHLAVLRASGLVEARRVARTVYYAIAAGPVQDIIRSLHANCCSADTAGGRSVRPW